MKPEDMAHLFGSKRLIRTEVATLIGYMIQAAPETFDRFHPIRRHCSRRSRLCSRSFTVD